MSIRDLRKDLARLKTELKKKKDQAESKVESK
jgi:ribosomal protein L29